MLYRIIISKLVNIMRFILVLKKCVANCESVLSLFKDEANCNHWNTFQVSDVILVNSTLSEYKCCV